MLPCGHPVAASAERRGLPCIAGRRPALPDSVLQPAVRVLDRSVTMRLRPGVTDPSAPPGGMPVVANARSRSTIVPVDRPPAREPMIDPDTRFSDEETRRILARAADREAPAAQKPGTGLTLHALQEIARETGIDPRHVEAAAREMVLRRSTAPAPRRLGLPLSLDARRVVPGRVTDAQWERMVAEFRRAFRKSGATSQFGEVREWISENEEGAMPVKVRLEPVDGGTLVTIGQPTTLVPQLVYGLGGGLTGMAAVFGGLAAVAGAPVGLPLLFLGMAAATAGGVRFGYGAWMPRREKQFEALLDRAELIARAS